MSADSESTADRAKAPFTSRLPLLPNEDVEVYQRHVQQVIEQYKPVGYVEGLSVQSIADCEWRMRRASNMKAGVYTVGRHNLAEKFKEVEDPATREALIEAQVLIEYAKQLKMLDTFERHLTSSRKRHIALLNNLRIERGKSGPKPIAFPVQRSRPSRPKAHASKAKVIPMPTISPK